MPLYEYICSKCGTDFEKMVRFSEADQSQACPECQSPDTRKKISRIAVTGAASGGSFAPAASSCGGSGRFS